MSQMVTRKRTGGDEKEKRTDSPVKDMKKKMAANAEKEKNAAEQASSKPADKPADKPIDKPANKPIDKPADRPANKPIDKPADKPNKPIDKPANKPIDKPANKPIDKLADKSAEKPNDKAADKTQKADKVPEKPAERKEKPAEKKDGQSEKKKEDSGKGESSGKPEKSANGRPKQNGSNGVNGTVSPESDSDSLVVDEDELFPELAYDDSDEFDAECPGRSLTRRSQVKATRTPETPRPASDKQEPSGDDSKESKVLKLNQDSSKAETPKSDAKKSEAKSDAKKPETTKDAKQDVQETAKADAKEVKESPKKDHKKEEKTDKVEVEVVVEIESTSDPSEESRKPDTNFSKSRVKVSPYRRSMRLADQTTSSVAANYTGNNTTMEMDITESSIMEESLDDSYLSGLRSIRGRRSYKLLKDMPLRVSNRSLRSTTSIVTTSEQALRPTAPVVGRKRKPEPEQGPAREPEEAEEAPAAGKRQRLLARLARPFRRTLAPVARGAEIVGINTDLPLTAPIASTSGFDPESLKAAPALPLPALPTPVAESPEDAKRCVVM